MQHYTGNIKEMKSITWQNILHRCLSLTKTRKNRLLGLNWTTFGECVRAIPVIYPFFREDWKQRCNYRIESSKNKLCDLREEWTHSDTDSPPVPVSAVGSPSSFSANTWDRPALRSGCFAMVAGATAPVNKCNAEFQVWNSLVPKKT